MSHLDRSIQNFDYLWQCFMKIKQSNLSNTSLIAYFNLFLEERNGECFVITEFPCIRRANVLLTKNNLHRKLLCDEIVMRIVAEVSSIAIELSSRSTCSVTVFSCKSPSHILQDGIQKSYSE